MMHVLLVAGACLCCAIPFASTQMMACMAVAVAIGSFALLKTLGNVPPVVEESNVPAPRALARDELLRPCRICGRPTRVRGDKDARCRRCWRW